jgi:hypothetical protein
MTLGKALEISGDEAAREQYWFALGKQRSTDIVSGSLCLGFCVASLDSEQHAQVGRRLAGSAAVLLRKLN